jgi:hypothetical protein
MTVFMALSKGEYLSVDSREQLVESFIRLVLETKPTHVLARDEVVMESVVQLMAGTTVILENVVHRRLYRTMTVKIVMEMTKNPCNRRILAKTPGMVSSMIRYTRTEHQQEETVAVTMHDSSSNNGNDTLLVAVSREDLKRQIFILAEAL